MAPPQYSLCLKRQAKLSDSPDHGPRVDRVLRAVGVEVHHVIAQAVLVAGEEGDGLA